MTSRIEPRAREAIRPVRVRHPPRLPRIGQVAELREPSREHRPEGATGGKTEEAVALSVLHVLVAAPDHERVLQPELPEGKRHCVQLVIDIHQQLGAKPLARLHDGSEIRHDVRVPVEDRGHEYRGCPFVDYGDETLRQVVHGYASHFHDFDVLLGQPVELTADGVELSVGGDQPGAGAKGEGGQEANHALVRVGGQGNVPARIPEQAAPTGAHEVSFLAGSLPLPVDVKGSIRPTLPADRRTSSPAKPGGNAP